MDSTNRNSFGPEVKCGAICTDWRETEKFSAVLRGDLVCCLNTDGSRNVDRTAVAKASLSLGRFVLNWRQQVNCYSALGDRRGLHIRRSVSLCKERPAPTGCSQSSRYVHKITVL